MSEDNLNEFELLQAEPIAVPDPDLVPAHWRLVKTDFRLADSFQDVNGSYWVWAPAIKPVEPAWRFQYRDEPVMGSAAFRAKTRRMLK